MRDPMLLPEDGFIDQMAVAIASHGLRRVQLTMRERELATAFMLLRGATRSSIARNLGLPSLYCADRLMRKARSQFQLAA